MANLSDLSSIMSVAHQDDVMKQFTNEAVLANLIPIEDGAGANCAWDVKLDGRTAGGPYAEGAAKSDGDFDTHTRIDAVLSWAQYRKGAKVTGLAQAAAGSIGGTNLYAGNPDAFVEELLDAAEELAVELAADLYAGNPAASPTELAGAAVAIAAGSSAFAGIDPDDHPAWVSGVNSVAVGDLTFSALRTKLFRPVKNATRRLPDFCTVDGATFDILLDKFEASAETISEIRTYGRGVVALERLAGARAISLDGVPFVEDPHCTASYIYAWNSAMVRIRQLPPKGITMDPARMVRTFAELGVPVTESDIVARLAERRGRIAPVIDLMGKSGDSDEAYIKWYGQIVWRRRNAFAKLQITA